jgi:hypothetical protein
VSGLSIKDGAEVECGGRRFIIMQLIGFDFVVARDIETDDLVRLAVVDLNPVSLAPSPVPSLPDLSKVDDRHWPCGHRRASSICRPGCLDALRVGPGVPRVGAALVAASV